MRSGARRTAARHQPAIAPLVLKRTMREFPPLPKVTLFGDPIPSPAYLGDVHPDHSYAMMALGMGASIPPPHNAASAFMAFSSESPFGSSRASGLYWPKDKVVVFVPRPLPPPTPPHVFPP